MEVARCFERCLSDRPVCVRYRFWLGFVERFVAPPPPRLVFVDVEKELGYLTAVGVSEGERCPYGVVSAFPLSTVSERRWCWLPPAPRTHDDRPAPRLNAT